MKLIYKFLIPVIVFTVLFSIILGEIISDQIKEHAIISAQQVTAEHIQAEAAGHLPVEIFQNPDFENRLETFNTFMDRIKTRAVIKIKVFNADSRIIFSTKNENIGKTTESNNYKTALTGDVAVNIKPPLEEKENIDLSGYKQIMEIYVPIKYNDEIAGVIVTYYKLDSLNEHIQATKRKICIAIGIFAVTILASFFIILSVVVINPVKKITDVSNKISNGDLNIHLPEIKTRDEIKDLNEALKGVFAVVELLTDEVKRLESKGKGNGISTS